MKNADIIYRKGVRVVAYDLKTLSKAIKIALREPYAFIGVQRNSTGVTLTSGISRGNEIIIPDKKTLIVEGGTLTSISTVTPFYYDTMAQWSKAVTSMGKDDPLYSVVVVSHSMFKDIMGRDIRLQANNINISIQAYRNKENKTLKDLI